MKITLLHLYYFAILSTHSTSTETTNHPRNQIGRRGVQVKKENENSPSCVPLLRKTLNLFISLSCFAEDGKEMYKNKTHVQSDSLLIKPFVFWRNRCRYWRCFGSLKPATHLAILYADRRDRRKSSGVPGAAIAIFADRRDRRIKSPISGMSDIGD